MATVIFKTATGAGTWTVPSDCASAQIECIGGGGGGYSYGAGGGGGAYVKTNAVSLTPGQTAYFNIGAGGGAGSSGGDTWFNKSANVAPGSATDGALAKAGAVSADSGSTGGLGGASASCVGDVAYSGGDGGDGASSYGGGGGGGAAGPSGVGKNGGDGGTAGGGGGGGSNGGSSTAGAAGGATNGGDGGDGTGGSGGGAGGSVSDGSPGSDGGGGGGGAQGTHAGGAGGSDVAFDGSHGCGGGGGGGGEGVVTGGDGASGGSYGGGGGGGGDAFSVDGAGGSGAQGVLVITYEPSAALARGGYFSQFDGGALGALLGASFGAFSHEPPAPAAAVLAVFDGAPGGGARRIWSASADFPFSRFVAPAPQPQVFSEWGAPPGRRPTAAPFSDFSYAEASPTPTPPSSLTIENDGVRRPRRRNRFEHSLYNRPNPDEEAPPEEIRLTPEEEIEIELRVIEEMLSEMGALEEAEDAEETAGEEPVYEEPASAPAPVLEEPGWLSEFSEIGGFPPIGESREDEVEDAVLAFIYGSAQDADPEGDASNIMSEASEKVVDYRDELEEIQKMLFGGDE